MLRNDLYFCAQQENIMLEKYWIKCPICNGKTRVQVFYNTVLRNFLCSALNVNNTYRWCWKIRNHNQKLWKTNFL